MLTIKNLHAEADSNLILKDFNLRVNNGEIHAIMGPNGSGKSTFSKVISGHPQYKVTKGEVIFEKDFRQKNLLDLEPEERAGEGIFLSFQYPIEIPGVSNFSFLQAAFNSICRYQGADEMNDDNFRQLLNQKLQLLKMNPDFLERSVNVDFSGGEKKRNEILQMAVLNPTLALLDETDSGLDIDSMRIVASGINALKNQDNSFVIITHYQRLLNYIVPDFVHVLYNGQIIKTGDKSLAIEVEKKGYDWLIN